MIWEFFSNMEKGLVNQNHLSIRIVRLNFSKEINNDKLTILYEPYCEPYHILMGELPYNFIFYQHKNARKWDYRFGPMPKNHRSVTIITPDIQPDLVIAQSRQRHTLLYRDIAKKYKCRMLNIEYAVPQKNEAENLYGVDNLSVYFSPNQADAWWADRAAIIKPAVLPAQKIEHKISINNSADFLSFFDVLRAMSEANCVISTPVYEIQNIIQNMVNGFLYNINDQKYLHQLISKIQSDQGMIIDVGNRAKQHVDNNFNISDFKQSWTQLIDECTK